MKIKKISVEKFRNLVDFECSFSDSNISAFIGNNGAGKSNIIELITEVFSEAKNATHNSNAAVGEPDIINCNIDYEYNGVDYSLNYDNFEVNVYLNKKPISKKDLNTVLPETIMLYYAGETERQLERANATIDVRYDNVLKKSKEMDFPGFKFLDYYSTNDLGLLLIVAAIYKGEYYKKLLQLLNCSEILMENTLVITNPKRKGNGEADSYWGARGFVKNFLDELKKYAARTKDIGENYVMAFNDVSLWKKTSENEAALFTKLKALKNAGYIRFFSVSLKRNDENTFIHEYLSEGEKQLALLYLLTNFTAKNNCLYLFDEFDSYLHLNWQRSISQMLNEVNVNGHIIFTTHSPATISKMQKEDVYILNEGSVYKARSETFNRSLDEIIEEQMKVSLRPQEYTDLVQEFRNAVIHNQKELALKKLGEIKDVVGEDDPFLITARLVMERMS